LESRIRKATAAVLAATLIGACASSPRGIQIQKVAGAPGAWAVGKKGHTVFVRADDEAASIEFGGRVFVVKGIGTFRGAITTEQVLLVGTRMEVYLTPEVLRVSVKHGEDRAWPLDTMPAHARVVYADGQIRFE